MLESALSAHPFNGIHAALAPCQTSEQYKSCDSRPLHMLDLNAPSTPDLSPLPDTGDLEPIMQIDASDDSILDSHDMSRLRFENLPIEVHEAILDHLLGVRRPTLSANSGKRSNDSSWSRALRHPRRKDLSNLSLVSPIWRPLVQERIYRHS